MRTFARSLSPNALVGEARNDTKSPNCYYLRTFRLRKNHAAQSAFGDPDHEGEVSQIHISDDQAQKAGGAAGERLFIFKRQDVLGQDQKRVFFRVGESL
jgi:hypothetical protein